MRKDKGHISDHRILPSNPVYPPPQDYTNTYPTTSLPPEKNASLTLLSALSILHNSSKHDASAVLIASARVLTEVKYLQEGVVTYLRVIEYAQKELRDRISVDTTDTKGS